MINHGLGETLYESASVAFDTTRGIYFNPINNVDYGVAPPSGGWPINWWGSPNDIHVPVGQGVIAQTQGQADTMHALVQAQLTGTGSSTNASNQSSSQNVTTSPTTQLATGLWDYLQGHSMFGVQDTYLAIGAVLLAGYYMTHKSRGRR